MRRIIWLLFLVFLIPTGTLAETVKEYDENGNCVKEMYFENDQPFFYNDSYYGISRVFEDGKCISITYLDADGFPMFNKSGYARVDRTLDGAGHVIREMYYGTDGKPIALSGNQYGFRRDAFDERGNCIQYTYLDADGNPMMLTSGYSTVKRAYNEQNKVDINMYYDINGQPAKLWLGQYGVHYEYDEKGRTFITSYLDSDGEPMITSAGYTTIKRDYDGDQVKIEWYYDQNGELIEHRGRSGVRLVYESGKIKERVPIDRQGHDLFLLDHYLPQHPWLVVLGAIVVVIVSMLLPKKWRWVLLTAYCIFILYMTLYVRESSGNTRFSLQVFRSLKQAIDNDEWPLWNQIMNNILLFIPLGVMVFNMMPRISSMILCLALSIGIETVQLITGLGFCEIDDVIWNGLGGIIGTGAAWMIRKIKKNDVSPDGA